MSLLTKTYDVFKKAVVALMILFVSVLFVGSWFTASQVKLGANFHTVLLVFFWILLVLQLYCFIKWMYRFFERADEKSHRNSSVIAAVMLLLMAAGLGVVIATIRYIPATDSFDDVETAMILWKNGKLIPEHMSYPHMELFKNNYLMTLMFSWLFQLLSAVGIGDYLLPMFIINAVCILLCAWLTWLSVKECFGIVKANKTLLLLVLNPVFYGIVEWVYSMTLALPIFSGILYCLIRAYKAKSLVGELVFGGILGLLTVLGYFIRVTSLFPLCAALVMAVFLVFKKKIYRKALISGVAFLAAFTALWLCLTPAIDRVFSETKKRNLPIGNWLAMGAHGDGSMNVVGDDIKNAYNIEDPAERSKFCNDLAIRYYKENGIWETLRLWGYKNIVTFSDGYSSIHSRLSSGEVKSDFFYFFCKPQHNLFKIYADAFRVLTLFMIMVLLVRVIRRKTVQESVFAFILTFFGALVFYAFWESKNIYSAQFLPVIFTLAMLGFDEINDTSLFTKLLEKKKIRYAVSGGYAVAAMTVGLITTLVLGEYAVLDFGRVLGIVDANHTPITSVNHTIEQDFYSEKEFNYFRFPLKELNKDALSNYTISVLDENGNTVDGCLLSDETFVKLREYEDGTACVNVLFNNVFSGGHYRVRLEKTDTEKGTIEFCSKKSYYIDTYRGELTVDGKGGYVGDLTMDVSYNVHRPYFRAPAQILFFVLYAAWAAGCYLAAVRCFYKNVKREEPLP